MASAPAAGANLRAYSDRMAGNAPLSVYIAASFRHRHGVRLLQRELASLGCAILDWTEKAQPPQGLDKHERRKWMDADQGGTVYDFCRFSCLNCDILIYYGASGQDAGVEVGLASAAGVPTLGIAGPLEDPGLMLHGAVDVWVDGPEDAIEVVAALCGRGAGRSQAASALAQRLEQRASFSRREDETE